MNWRVSWRRRYSSYIALYFGKSVPILIYQMGKVGSSSLRNTLLLRGLHPVLHLHTFSPLREKLPEEISIDDHLKPAVVQEIDHAKWVYSTLSGRSRFRLMLREWTNERRIGRQLLRPERPLKLVTSVREPIAANVSMFFQLLPWYTRGRYRPDRISTDELIRLFFERFSCFRPLIWFDEEMKYATGVDVYQHPFALDRGFSSFRAENIEVLVLKAETDDAVKEHALSDFLGVGAMQLEKSNVAEQKPYAAQYAEFKQRIRFPDEFFRAMYDSKYARHFYTDAEIQGYHRQWHGPSESTVPEK